MWFDYEQLRLCTLGNLTQKAFDSGRKETEVCHDFHISMSDVCCVNLRPAPRYLCTFLLTVWMTKNDTGNLTCLSLISYNFLPEIIQSLLLSAACIRSSLTDSNQSVCLASRARPSSGIWKLQFVAEYHGNLDDHQ